MLPRWDLIGIDGAYKVKVTENLVTIIQKERSFLI